MRLQSIIAAGTGSTELLASCYTVHVLAWETTKSGPWMNEPGPWTPNIYFPFSLQK